METDADRRLPVLETMPDELRNLTFIEKRLISFMRVNEFLLDLPTNHVPGQWGRVYVTPLEEPDACHIMEGTTVKDGVIYIASGGHQENAALPARPGKIAKALQYLLDNHPRYSATPAIKKSVEDAIHELAACEHEENNPEHPASEIQDNALTHGGPMPAGAVAAELKKARGHADLKPDIDVLIFPHLFSTGSGGFPGLKTCKLPDYCRKRLLGEDARFQQDPQYIFWLLEMWFKHKVSSNTQVFVGPQSSSRLFPFQHQIRHAAYTSLRQVPGTQPYIYAKRSVGLSMIEQLGKPKWFMTLTCHAKQPSILLACIVASLRTEQGMALDPSNEVLDKALEVLDSYLRHDEVKWPLDVPGAHARTASELCNAFPAVVAREFMRHTRALMRWLGAEQDVEEDPAAEPDVMDDVMPVDTVRAPPQPPFHISDYTLRIEWQKRGYPHAHIMMWTRQDLAPAEGCTATAATAEHDFGGSDAESLLDERPAITTEQLYDKYVCTRSPRRWREIYRDQEMANLAEFLVHKHTAYCGAYSLGACRFGFPHPAVPRTRAKEARETMVSRSKNTYLVRRRSDANMMGLYNPSILRKWRGSMDLQAISDAHNAHKYIMGYNFKMEDDTVTHRRVEELIARLSTHGDINAQDVYRVAHAALQGRSTSTFEACHLLLGEPVVQFSRDNTWIQTCRPEEWTIAVPANEESIALKDPADYADTRRRMPGLLQHYSDVQKEKLGGDVELPVEGSDHRCRVPRDQLTFFDFVAGLRVERKDGSVLLTVRRKPAIVGHRTFNPDVQSEDFYYAKLLLHTVWTTPGDWLQDADEGSHARAFHRLLKDSDTFMSSVCYPNFDASLSAARELARVQAEMYLRAQLDGNEAQEHYQGSLEILEKLRTKCVDVFDMDIPDNVATGDAGIAFGDVAGGEEAWQVLTSEVSEQNELVARQRKVMELIIAAAITPVNKDSAWRLRLILHGPGGCGKPFVLRAAAHKIRHAQKGVVIAAYTGAAAYQAGGVTLHSCLGLPVVNKSYGQHEGDVPLPQGARLDQLRSLWRHVEMLFIDEMSLVSEKLLKRIDTHLRYIRSHGSHLPFGGIHLVMIGDFFQLPPVLDYPMLRDMATLRLFQLCELVGNHRAAKDPAWAAMLGRIRTGSHTEADMTFLRGRRKKTIPPNAVRLCATRAGVAALNQQMLENHLKTVPENEVYDCPAQDTYERTQLEPSAPSNAYANAEDDAPPFANQSIPRPHKAPQKTVVVVDLLSCSPLTLSRTPVACKRSSS